CRAWSAATSCTPASTPPPGRTPRAATRWASWRTGRRGLPRCWRAAVSGSGCCSRRWSRSGRFGPNGGSGAPEDQSSQLGPPRRRCTCVDQEGPASRHRGWEAASQASWPALVAVPVLGALLAVVALEVGGWAAAAGLVAVTVFVAFLRKVRSELTTSHLREQRLRIMVA